MSAFIMDNLFTILQSVAIAILATVAWWRNEVSKSEKAKRDRERVQLEAQIQAEKDKRDNVRIELEGKIRDSENTHNRAMQDMRNEFEQLRVAHEQNKSLTEIVHTSIASSNTVVNAVAELVKSLNENRIESISFRNDMRGIIETLGLQLGNVDKTSKRTEQIVTEKTTLTMQSIEALVRNNEMVKAALETLTGRIEAMSEIQDSHIEAANKRHTQSSTQMKDGFKSIVDALLTVQKVLETNNAMLQQSLTKRQLSSAEKPNEVIYLGEADEKPNNP